ncbi:MAG: SAM-dependent methyltransferase [Cyanobacteria bacterium P01_D01_bin.36]
MSVLSFLLLELLLAPLTLTSFLLLQVWAVTISKQQQLSITALAPLFFRWLLHIQGIRPDAVTQSFITHLSSSNGALCWGCVGPTLLAANLTGYTPSFLSVPPAGKEHLSNMIHTRTLFFDRAIAQSLDTAEQIVILGAGFDTRLFKFCLGQGHALPARALFEVDQLATQQAKIQALKNSQVAFSDVNFVSVNFNQENWADKLVQAGFVPGKQTFFLWEGVTYYLTEAIVKETLVKVAEISGEGSAIAFDVFSSHFVSGTGEWQWIQPALNILTLMGEPFRFGINLQTDAPMTRLLQDTGFQLQSFQTMRNDKPVFSGLVSAVKP